MKNCWYFLALTSFFSYASEDLVQLPKFDENTFSFWEKEVFSGETDYKPIVPEYILHAKSDGTASGLVFKKKIDIYNTPYMNWSWKADNRLKSLPERAKAGDDYVARIYLVINDSLLPWDTKVLNYVWSSTDSIGEHWDSPYAGSQVKMLSVRDSNSKTDVWYFEKRNVFEDMIDVFGDQGSRQANIKSYQYIDAVALMTDTDDSESRAESYYGSISFSDK
ncbi:DUF3047 domain-containing protein [Vibrio mediterranei]|uniref:DUF3047 domain-containing protein n=1 Tax=Vibrio mediterranei TaxID=689 RepID=UPI001EFC9F14|nr:DUF3047 domain-containing protein [Vibrio mediterranei]MCG9659964.1 DUF3047 domain-containing protein [Vibrio mediterranei]